MILLSCTAIRETEYELKLQRVSQQRKGFFFSLTGVELKPKKKKCAHNSPNSPNITRDQYRTIVTLCLWQWLWPSDEYITWLVMAMGRVVVSMTMDLCTYKTVLSRFTSSQYEAKKRVGIWNWEIKAFHKNKSILMQLSVMIKLSN